MELLVPGKHRLLLNYIEEFLIPLCMTRKTLDFFIDKNIPKEIGNGDFQDYVIWREFNYTLLKYIESEYDGVIIVPMTIVNPLYFDEIIGRLRKEKK